MVRASVERWLEQVRLVDGELADGPVAATALAMADRLDGDGGSPSECGKVLLMALEQLRVLLPPVEEADAVDDIGDELADRRARVAAAASPSRP